MYVRTKPHMVSKFTDISAVGDLKSVSLDSTLKNIEILGKQKYLFSLEVKTQC